jgi:hypothetical protein
MPGKIGMTLLRKVLCKVHGPREKGGAATTQGAYGEFLSENIVLVP